jgi:hypothetical protein
LRRIRKYGNIIGNVLLFNNKYMSNKSMLDWIDKIETDDIQKIKIIKDALDELCKTSWGEHDAKAEDFEWVKSKADLKAAIIKLLGKVSLWHLKPTDVAGSVDTIVDAMWSMYETVKSTWKSFVTWIKENFNEAMKFFNNKFGTPRQLSMRNLVDKVYWMGYQVIYSQNKYKIINKAWQSILEWDTDKILNNELESKRNLQNILTERSLTSEWNQKLSTILLEAGINPLDDEAIKDMKPKDLAEVYLKYSQKWVKPAKTLDTIRPDEIKSLPRLTQIQKDFIALQAWSSSRWNFWEGDMDFFKKAINEHNEALFGTKKGLQGLKAQTSESLHTWADMLKHPGEVLKYISWPEMLMLMAWVIATMVFDVSWKRKEIWQAVMIWWSWLVLTNILTKWYNKDKDKWLSYQLWGGTEKLSKWLKDPVKKARLEVLSKKLNESPEDLGVLMEIAALPAEKVLSNLRINKAWKLDFENYETTIDDETRDSLDKTFWKWKWKQKLLDMLEAMLRLKNPRWRLDKTAHQLALKYPQSKNYIFWQVIDNEFLAWTKSDPVIWSIESPEDSEPVEQEPKSAKKTAAPKAKEKTPTVNIEEMAWKYAWTWKIWTVSVSRALLLNTINSSKSNKEKASEIRKITWGSAADMVILEGIAKELNK